AITLGKPKRLARAKELTTSPPLPSIPLTFQTTPRRGKAKERTMDAKQVRGMMIVGGIVAALLVLSAPASALTVTSATQVDGGVRGSGSQAAKAGAPIRWEGGGVTYASAGGFFVFSSTNIPADCIGSVSDGGATVLVPIEGCVPHAFPATGQTTSYMAGDDGAIRAGAALSYTDNGDGTITDNNTGLMWEKQSDDGSIHDKDNAYTWADAVAVHIAGLNAGAGFAGHTDWRLPNVKELQSIVNYQNVNPTVSPAFNTGCVASCTVLTCSCTAAGITPLYWSSTSFAVSPAAFAWSMDFSTGIVFQNGKSDTFHVRAVRGGR